VTVVHRSPGETFAGYTQLEALSCANCGVLFAAPEHMLDKRRDNHETFYCPSGHSNYFPDESQAEKYKRLFNAEKDRRAQVQARADQTQASLSATRGVVTKQRKKLERVSKGICPCCNRSFRDLKRHMQTKHPDYAGQPQ
jgi:hypothetical protein